MRPDDIELWVSNGSGLYRSALSGVVSRDGSLLSAAGQLETSLVRVVRSNDRSGCVDVAFFLSRRLMPEDAFSYPCEWIGVEQASYLCQDGEQIGQYRLLPASRPTRLQVSSPSRLRIESRLIYGPRKAEANQRYQFRVTGDRLNAQTFDVHTRHESRHIVQVDGIVRSVGEHEVQYVDIPAGNQAVVIEGTASAYVRLTAAPCQTAYPTAFMGEHDVESTNSIWDLTSDNALGQMMLPDHPAQRRWRLAQRIGRDNRYRDGGLQAWNILRQLAGQTPAHRELSRWVGQAESAYTAWRSISSIEGQGSLHLSKAWFITRSLPLPGANTYSPLVSRSLVDDAVDSLAGGNFIQLPAGEHIICRLPPESLDTQIRLAVDRDVPSVVTVLSVQYDASPRIELLMYGHEQQPMALRQPSTAEVGLAAMHHQFGPFDSGTLGGPFSRRRQPAPRIAAATAVLNASHGTRLVRVTNHASHPIRVCLHYRTSRDVRLSESTFLAYLARQPDLSATMTAMIANQQPSLADREAFEELRNHCVPFLDRLRMHRRTFEASIARLTPSQLDSRSPQSDLDRHVERAQQLTQQRQYVPAREAWTQIVDRSEGRVHKRPSRRRIDVLNELGEDYLVETELRGRVLYDTDHSVRVASARRLADIYAAKQDDEAFQRLASAVMFTDPSGEALASLSEAAVRNADWSTRCWQVWRRRQSCVRAKFCCRPPTKWGGGKSLSEPWVKSAIRSNATIGMPGGCSITATTRPPHGF